MNKIVDSVCLSSPTTKVFFIIFSQKPYLATGSNLSWYELAMVKLVASQRKCNSEDTATSKVSKINNYLIEYVPNTLVKNN